MVCLSLQIMKLLLHFLALFSYLNILCFEVKYGSILDFRPVDSNETLIEVVLEEMLDMSLTDDHESIPEIIYDEYRILVLSLGLAAVVLFFNWLTRNLLLLYNAIKHPIYLSKTICLPGYYSFLFRYSLF